MAHEFGGAHGADQALIGGFATIRTIEQHRGRTEHVQFAQQRAISRVVIGDIDL